MKKAQKVFWGDYSGYFKDPDDHLWEVAHNPHCWVGPKEELTRRKANLMSKPTAGISWDELKARIRSRHGR